MKRDTTGATLEDRFDKTVSLAFLLIFESVHSTGFLKGRSFLHLLIPPGSAEGDAGEELWEVFKDQVHPFG